MRADYVNASTLGIILLKLLKMTVVLLFCCTLVCSRSISDCSDGLQLDTDTVICAVVLYRVMLSHAQEKGHSFIRSSFNLKF